MTRDKGPKRRGRHNPETDPSAWKDSRIIPVVLLFLWQDPWYLIRHCDQVAGQGLLESMLRKSCRVSPKGIRGGRWWLPETLQYTWEGLADSAGNDHRRVKGANEGFVTTTCLGRSTLGDSERLVTSVIVMKGAVLRYIQVVKMRELPSPCKQEFC